MSDDESATDEHDAGLDPRQLSETRRGRRRILWLYALAGLASVVAIIMGSMSAGTWPF